MAAKKRPPRKPPEPAPEAPELTADDARQLLRQEAEQRVAQCSDAVEAVLKQFGCGIATRLMWTEDGRAAAAWRVQAIE